MILYWLSSRTVRHACYLSKQVRRILNEQRDILAPEAIQAVSKSYEQLQEALRSRLGLEEIKQRMANLEETAENWFRPYPNHSIRENVKEVFVAVTIILAVTTFFVQLTKIPTGSLQPTLYGITYDDESIEVPNRLTRFFQYWTQGVSYFHVVAKNDGYIGTVEDPRRLFPFVRKQSFHVGPEKYTVWFPTDELLGRAGIVRGRFFRRGEDIMKVKVVSGDHLLVDRFTYNFRPPKRGEIAVFKTRGIRGLNQDQLYIKRLVALGGERVVIGNDNHIRIDGDRLDATYKGFENVYTFDPSAPKPNGYFGHVNNHVARQNGNAQLARLFQNGDDEFHVPEGEYLAMGDNTLNSLDSRDWGGVPQENVTGRAWFVYWPISERFGWGPR